MWKLALVSMGFLLSPRAFMTAGSGIGLSGDMFFLIVAALVATHTVNARYGVVDAKGASSVLLGGAGYGIRAFTLAFISCSILGVAGYAFNEVFFHWFPNFLFSFVILGCSLVASALSPAAFRKLQCGTVALTLLGVAILVIASLGVDAPAQAEDPEFYAPYALSPLTEGLAFMAALFVGYELLREHASAAGEPLSGKPLMATVVLTGVTLTLFSQAIFHVAGAERLADSTVPHMIGARRLLGQTGRYIMGGVIILGSFAAVNVVMAYLQRPIAAFLASRHAEKTTEQGFGRRLMSSAVPAIVVSVLLLMGYAGEQVTESYIAGGLGFWLLLYAVTSLAAIPSVDAFGKTAALLAAIVCVYLAYGAASLAEDMGRALTAPVVFFAVSAVIAFLFRKRLSS